MNKVEKFMVDMNCDINTLYEVLANSTEEYAWVCSPPLGTIRYSAKMIEEFDLPDEIVKDPLIYWKKLVHKDDWQKFYDTNIKSFSGELIYHIVEFRAKNRKGEWVWLQCRGTVILDENNKPYLFGGYISNMGRRNKVDFQTGLFNKYEFRNQIEKWINEKKYLSFGVIVLGIDNFRNIVELYSREFGDEILREIAQKIQSIASGDVEVYHLDSDEFGILIKEATKEKMLDFYYSVQNQFKEQQECCGKKYFCTLSGGASIMPNDGQSYLELSHSAETSMHYAKRCKKNSFLFFSPEIVAANDNFLSLLECLRESIDNNFNGFYLVYQPQVYSKDGSLKGVEALLRWKSDKFPSIGPAQFIPVLEESGLIHPIGHWIIREAVKTCQKWNQYCPDITMSINISNRQVFSECDLQQDLFSYIFDVLEKEKVNRKNIILEFTESSVASDINYLLDKMNEVRKSGIQIAIDDFGTGYSSLGFLKRMPADFVKLDKLFVDGIINPSNNFDSTFIKLVTELCHSVNIEIVQEGVETEAQYNLIQELGPDYIQGFYFCRPITQQEVFDRYIKYMLN